ncbi:MAG: hypothetical protein AAB384_01610 [Patescibacteria group bacterium]
MNTSRFFSILGMMGGLVLLGFSWFVLQYLPNDAPTAPLLASHTTRAVVAAILGLLFLLPAAYVFPIIHKLQRTFEKNETSVYVHGFSWGAFLFAPAWALMHRQWALAGVSFLVLMIPIFGVVFYAALAVELGFSGRQIAWKSVAGHKSLAVFKREEWIGLVLAVVAGALVYSIFIIPTLITRIYAFIT